MGVSGQLHASADLPLGKEPIVPIGQKVFWARKQLWTLWSKEELIVPAWNRIRDVQSVARRYTDWLPYQYRVLGGVGGVNTGMWLAAMDRY
jgi:hypothetical protein